MPWKLILYIIFLSETSSTNIPRDSTVAKVGFGLNTSRQYQHERGYNLEDYYGDENVGSALLRSGGLGQGYDTRDIHLHYHIEEQIVVDYTPTQEDNTNKYCVKTGHGCDQLLRPEIVTCCDNGDVCSGGMCRKCVNLGAPCSVAVPCCKTSTCFESVCRPSCATDDGRCYSGLKCCSQNKICGTDYRCKVEPKPTPKPICIAGDEKCSKTVPCCHGKCHRDGTCGDRDCYEFPYTCDFPFEKRPANRPQIPPGGAVCCHKSRSGEFLKCKRTGQCTRCLYSGEGSCHRDLNACCWATSTCVQGRCQTCKKLHESNTAKCRKNSDCCAGLECDTSDGTCHYAVEHQDCVKQGQPCEVFRKCCGGTCYGSGHGTTGGSQMCS